MKIITSLALLTTFGFGLVDNVRTQSFDDQPYKVSPVKIEPIKVSLAEPKVIATAAKVPPEPVKAPVAAPTSYGGTKEDWLRQAGIPQGEWKYVDYIVSKESNWNPCAYNPGQSDCNANPTTACGLAQSLPCGKQATYGHWTDPVANLKWQYNYVTERYGGYAGAYSFWVANKWY